jgi:hypothetical protein
MTLKDRNIILENLKIEGIEDAFRGMRNPKNSWDEKAYRKFKYQQTFDDLERKFKSNQDKYEKQIIKNKLIKEV